MYLQVAATGNMVALIWESLMNILKIESVFDFFRKPLAEILPFQARTTKLTTNYIFRLKIPKNKNTRLTN